MTFLRVPQLCYCAHVTAYLRLTLQSLSIVHIFSKSYFGFLMVMFLFHVDLIAVISAKL